MVDDDITSAFSVERNKVNHHNGWLRVSATNFSMSLYLSECIESWNTITPQKSWLTVKRSVSKPLAAWRLICWPLELMHFMRLSNLLAIILSVLYFLLVYEMYCSNHIIPECDVLLPSYPDISLLRQVTNFYHSLPLPIQPGTKGVNICH